MLSDIFGLDKKEKFLIILNLMRNQDVVGILYGKEGIGKKFILKKILKNIAGNNDKVVFLDSGENWYVDLLTQLGLDVDEHITKEDFLVQFVNFLEKHPGRVFIIFDNGQNLSTKNIQEIVQLLGFKDKVSVVIVGTEELKEKLNPFKLGKVEASMNFIFEVKTPEFDEFSRYIKYKYGNKVDKKAVRKLYKLTEGSFKDANDIIKSVGKFPVYERDIGEGSNVSFILPFVGVAVAVGIGVVSYIYLFPKEENKNEDQTASIDQQQVEIIDKKLPEEGVVIQEPIIEETIREEDIYLENVDNQVKKAVENVVNKPVEEHKQEKEKTPEETKTQPPVEKEVAQNKPQTEEKKENTTVKPETKQVAKKETTEKPKNTASQPETKDYSQYKYVIHIASFKNRNSAESLKKRLEKFLKNDVRIIPGKNGANTVIVYARDRKEAESIASFVKKWGYRPWIVKRKSE
ncbi:MAG: AAA family ATPase [Aquificae bacterium]|nr:AAA family ATPase [Aquificota bacterium]